MCITIFAIMLNVNLEWWRFLSRTIVGNPRPVSVCETGLEFSTMLTDGISYHILIYSCTFIRKIYRRYLSVECILTHHPTDTNGYVCTYM